MGASLVALLAACNNQSKQADPQAATTTSTEAETPATPATVYVNSDSLLTNYEYFKEIRTRLQTKSQDAEKDLRRRADAFQKDVANYEQTAQGMTMQQRSTTEQRLAQRQQQLQALSQQTGNELAMEESEEMKKIYDKVEAYLQNLSKERGYKMVLTYQRGNSAILYGDSTLDITTDVVKGLNEQYASEKASAKKETPKK
ncbi:outer membrane chaperone Skp [Pontibacter sp. SGAir0037]|nr:outer membrane chaperone Skp [Pontibacter sp. SGAir0037]